MKKNIFLFLLSLVIIFPSYCLAFDLVGWWKNTKTGTVIKISDTEFNGRPYKISSKDDKTIWINIEDKTFKHSFKNIIEPDGKSAFFYTPEGMQKKHYRLITHDISLTKADIRKITTRD